MTDHKFPSPDLRNIPRDKARLELIKNVRLKYRLISIRNESERNKLLFCVWSNMNPDSWLGRAIREALWEDPDAFDKLDILSADTILRDNRALESEGFFQKEKEMAA